MLAGSGVAVRWVPDERFWEEVFRFRVVFHVFLVYLFCSAVQRLACVAQAVLVEVTSGLLCQRGSHTFHPPCPVGFRANWVAVVQRANRRWVLAPIA